MLEPSQIVGFVTEAVPATLIGSTIILLEKEEVHWFPSVTVKMASKFPEFVYVLLAEAVDAVAPSPKVHAYVPIGEFVVALGVLVLVNVIAAFVKQTVFADSVKLAVGAGVLLMVIDLLELATEVPHALFANTSKVPLPVYLPQ